MFTAYHSQINDQFERTNQIVEIALRFFLTENSKTNWISAASLIQADFNNFLNVVIDLSSNEIIYEFKIKDTLFFLITVKIENLSQFKILNLLNQTKLRSRRKATNVVFFVDVRVKIIHDKRHKKRRFFVFIKNIIFLKSSIKNCLNKNAILLQ
jgi:hypothetical protein